MILDEAQNIKNPDSQVAQVAYRLKAERKRALSEAALGTSDAAQGLTREDLLALLS